MGKLTDMFPFSKPGEQGVYRLQTWGLKFWNLMFVSMTMAQLVGFLVVANVLAQMCKLVLTLNWQETHYRMQTEMAEREMEQYGMYLSDDLQRTIQKYMSWRFLNNDFGPLQ